MSAPQIPIRKEKQEAERRQWHSFSANELIDAYQQGKEEGRDELFSILDETVRRNLKKAFGQSEKLFGYLEKNTKVTPEKVFMRMESPTEFCSLFLVSEADYVSEEMLEVMKEAKSRELEIREQAFSLTFSFMALSEHTSEASILSDGFNFSYPEKYE